jgi:hypothetical protein
MASDSKGVCLTVFKAIYIIQWFRRGNLLTANKRMKSLYPEAEFLDVIGLKILIVSHLAIHSHPN